MNREFVEQIEAPESLPLQRLQEEATEAVSNRLRQYDMEDVPEWVVRKLTWTYYHDWETDDPDFVFLLEDPGIPGEHVVLETQEYAELGEDYDPHDAIQIDRRFGSRWLATRRYTDFTSEFVSVCESAGLVSPNVPWWRYLLSGAFFDDFYVADVIKYRGADARAGDVKTAFSSCLLHELEYVDPDVVFAFGKRAWEVLRTECRTEPIDERPPGSGVTDVHGILHETDRLIDTYVLPLGHPSTNFRGAQLSHEEYISRLRTGVEGAAPLV
jgi:hypothetical protein